jgi:hypothetical protein
MIIETKQKCFLNKLLFSEYSNDKRTLKISINGLNISNIIFHSFKMFVIIKSLIIYDILLWIQNLYEDLI